MVAQLKASARIVVDPEFKAALISLTQEEYDGLESSLKHEGCRDALVFWPVGSELLLIDGHNRYEICTRLNIPFEIIERDFESRLQAKKWICQNQLAKRNLTAEMKAYYLGQSYNEEKQAHGGDRKSKGNICLLNTAEQLAKEEKVAPRTVKNAGKFAAAVDEVVANTGEEVRDKILKGEIKAKQRDVQALSKRPKREQKAAIKKVEQGKAKDIGKALTQLDTEKRVQESANVKLPEGCRIVSDLAELVAEGATFPTFYADCPWPYQNQGTRAATGNHYSTLSIEDLRAMPVPVLACDKSHLWMWATVAFRREAMDLIEAWGFENKSEIIWSKPQMGIGNYVRLSHEILLLGVKGSMRTRGQSQMSVVEADRTAHSAKPEKFRAIVEELSPGPYLELFGRMAVPGWTIFGNQVWTPDGERSLHPIEGPLFNGGK